MNSGMKSILLMLTVMNHLFPAQNVYFQNRIWTEVNED